MIRRAAAIIIGLSMTGPAGADLWEGFYTPRGAATQAVVLETIPALQSAKNPSGSACIDAILAAERRHDIPGNLLVAIGYQEAGAPVSGAMTVWPWTINVAGEGARFATRAAAIRAVRKARSQGVSSIDVGCLQVNLKWHPDAFPTLEAAFDPMRNAAYAARFLTRLRDETGSWRAAAAAYHSRTPKLGRAYLASLDTHIARLDDRLEAARRPAGPHARPRYAVPGASEHLPALSARRPDAVTVPKIGAARVTPPAPATRQRGAIWGASMDGARNAHGGSLFAPGAAAPITKTAKPLF